MLSMARAIHIALSSRAKPAARRAQAKDHEDMEVFYVVQDSFTKRRQYAEKVPSRMDSSASSGCFARPSLALHDRSSDWSLSPRSSPMQHAEKVPICMGSSASSGCFARLRSLCMTDPRICHFPPVKSHTAWRKSPELHGFVGILGMLRSPLLALHDRFLMFLSKLARCSRCSR
jgi:hypothetical protein